jgi:hypothetical protein
MEVISYDSHSLQVRELQSRTDCCSTVSMSSHSSQSRAATLDHRMHCSHPQFTSNEEHRNE